MSSSVTIDWRAVQEQERQAQAARRAELAQLAQRERQLRLRQAAVGAVRRAGLAEIPRVRIPGRDAGSTELAELVADARRGLTAAEQALDRTVSDIRQTRERPTQTGQWSFRTATTQEAPPGTLRQTSVRVPADVTSFASGRSDAAEQARLAAEADAVLEECRLRCPQTDVDDLLRLRAELGRGDDRAIVNDIRYRAAQIIQRVKRRELVEENRQRLLSLADDAPPSHRARFRQRLEGATDRELDQIEDDLLEVLEEDSRRRSRSQAMNALHASLTTLGYEVGESFASMLSTRTAEAAAQPGKDPVLVVSSPHSDDHGLRVRLGQDQVYLSVVRREGSADPHDDQALFADSEVQTRTCEDLEDVVTVAAEHGVALTVGNVQLPGRAAPTMPASAWARRDHETDHERAPESRERSADEQAETRAEQEARLRRLAVERHRRQSRARQPRAGGTA